jgi:hypothetical protein
LISFWSRRFASWACPKSYSAIISGAIRRAAMEFIIVTGLSGAGKSHAIHCMEDLGYYCVDNMPPQLIKDFISLAKKQFGKN